MPPTQIGPYRIVRTLGEGGMGVVYEAIQEPLGRRVALKLLLPQYAQKTEVLGRFFNEARAVNLIEHPSIVQISDHGQAPDGTAFLVMEFLRGETLAARIAQLQRTGQAVPVLQAIHIAAQIADALAAAHDHAVVHRDLKPANVMLVRDPVAPGGERAKVLDFGIAKLTQSNAGTATNALMGTPQYMAPEQCRGAGGVDEKSDVYALGVILYEMLAGRPPFVGDNAVEYIAQHIFEEPPPLRSFAKAAPPELVALVHRLLVKDKSLRPSMHKANSELSGLLARLSGGFSLAAPPTGEQDEMTRISIPTASPSTLGGSLGQRLPPPPSHRRRGRAFLVAAATLLTGVGVLGLSARRLLPPSESPTGAKVAPGSPGAPTPSPVAAPPAAAGKSLAPASASQTPPPDTGAQTATALPPPTTG